MKILIIIPNNILGGAEQLLKKIASYYSNEHVTLLFLRKHNEENWNGLGPKVDLQFMSSRHEIIGALRLFFKLLVSKRKTYDYIFTSQVLTNTLADILISLGLLKTKFFAARESTAVFLRYKGMRLLSYKLTYFLAYRNMDILVCQTKQMKTTLLNHAPYLKKRLKIEVLYNPIDLSAIQNEAEAPFDINITGPFIVTAGRLIEEKGFDVLIKAFSKVHENNKALKLVILGRGELQNELMDLADSLNIKNAVIFPGFVDNVYAYFKLASCCVVSSRIEGFPNVLLQMMSQNTSVVSTLCAGGIDEIEGLITMETNNETALAEGISKALSVTNKNNRPIFDEFLKHRNIGTYMAQLKGIK